MPSSEKPPPFVAFGATSMRGFGNAYAAAIRRRATTVGTLDVLAQAVGRTKWTPSWLSEGAHAGLMRLAAGREDRPGGRSAGDLRPGAAGEFDPEVRSVLRETEWRVRRSAGLPLAVPVAGVEDWDRRPRWTAGAWTMLTGALATARDHGMAYAGPVHLMFAMLAMPDCDGTRYLYPDESAWAAACEWLSKEPDLRRADRPYPDLSDLKAVMWPRPRTMRGRLARWMTLSASRLARVGPLLSAVETEARRQAVRCGHGVIGPAHTLLAVLAVDAALAQARMSVAPHVSGRNRAATALRAHGVDEGRLSRVAVRRGAPEDPPAEVLTRQLDRLRPGDPFDGAETVAAQARAMELALAYRHRDTGTSHLLLALVENDDGDAAAVLRDLGADPAAVRTRVEHDLRLVPGVWRRGDG